MSKKIYLGPKDTIPGTTYVDYDNKEYLYLGFILVEPRININKKDPLPPLGKTKGCYLYIQFNDEMQNMVSECENLEVFTDKLITMFAQKKQPWKKLTSMRFTPRKFISMKKTVFPYTVIPDHNLDVDNTGNYWRVGHMNAIPHKEA